MASQVAVKGAAEARLQTLVRANMEANRAAPALEWKRRGGKVIGVLCTYVPVEVLLAGGFLPWRVTGTWSENVADALVYRSANSCGYCNHVLQALLQGDLDFLDGVVATTWEQDLTRLWDVWHHLKKTEWNHILHLPHYPSAGAIAYYAEEIREFAQAVERWGGVKIDEGKLSQAIQLYNRARSLVRQVYQLRKREAPPLSGAEMAGLTLAGTILPPAQFIAELEGLLPYLENRRAPLAHFSPRVLLSADLFDYPAYVELIEGVGCLVAMDDLDTGIRYYSGEVEAQGEDPYVALARRYLGRTGTSRMLTWQAQVDQVVVWVKEFRIQGVVELTLRYSRGREMRRPYFLKKLEEAGVQAISLEREYRLANPGQLRTRLQAFFEVLGA